MRMLVLESNVPPTAVPRLRRMMIRLKDMPATGGIYAKKKKSELWIDVGMRMLDAYHVEHDEVGRVVPGEKCDKSDEHDGCVEQTGLYNYPCSSK